MKVKYKDQEIEIPENATIEVVNGDLVITPKENKFIPKDGDICYFNNTLCERILIFKSYVNKLCSHYCIFDFINNEIKYNDHCDKAIKRLATEEEKQKLLDALHKDGKYWDAENKKIVDYRWRANKGEYYWYINSALSIEYVYEQNILLDNARYNCGNYFFKEEQANQALEKIKEVLKPIK